MKEEFEKQKALWRKLEIEKTLLRHEGGNKTNEHGRSMKSTVPSNTVRLDIIKEGDGIQGRTGHREHRKQAWLTDCDSDREMTDIPPPFLFLRLYATEKHQVARPTPSRLCRSCKMECERH
ncbi:hypothetical protein GOODEAATRI_016207 [Goodea atripinnis]|uniref:Uncharacterized protein n=1 Tax=Goodea atripinnis TaxID=208336 RepID=A0ABV0NB19_9TELE